MPVLTRVSGTQLAAKAAQALAAREAAMLGRDTYRASTRDTRPAASTERLCANPGCSSRWLAPWKNRNRPIFEQEWACSSACMTRLVRAAVKRETGDGIRMDGDVEPRHRVPLGLVLLAQGWITHPQLQSALESQRASGRGRIGDWLMRGAGLPEERVARGLSVQWSCPVLSTDGFSPSAMALVMPKRFVAEFGMLALRTAGTGLLYLAFEQRLNAAAALGIERMAGLKVETGLLPESRFETVRSAVLASTSVPVEIRLAADHDQLTAGIVKALEQRQPVATRLVRVHQYYWLRMWLETGAASGTGTLPHSAEDVQDYLFLTGDDR